MWWTDSTIKLLGTILLIGLPLLICLFRKNKVSDHPEGLSLTWVEELTPCGTLIVDKDGNEIGIYQEVDGVFEAMRYSDNYKAIYTDKNAVMRFFSSKVINV